MNSKWWMRRCCARAWSWFWESFHARRLSVSSLLQIQIKHKADITNRKATKRLGPTMDSEHSNLVHAFWILTEHELRISACVRCVHSCVHNVVMSVFVCSALSCRYLFAFNIRALRCHVGIDLFCYAFLQFDSSVLWQATCVCNFQLSIRIPVHQYDKLLLFLFALCTFVCHHWCMCATFICYRSVSKHWNVHIIGAPSLESNHSVNIRIIKHYMLACVAFWTKIASWTIFKDKKPSLESVFENNIKYNVYFECQDRPWPNTKKLSTEVVV